MAMVLKVTYQVLFNFVIYTPVSPTTSIYILIRLSVEGHNSE